MVDWYLAPALETGRTEVNLRWPNRDKRSDGTIGDAAHQTRASDHNPNARGSVNAWDMDVGGVDARAVKEAFERHPSAHYWIHDGKIADADNGFNPVDYNGSNPHIEHVHFSIRQTAIAEQNRRSWGIWPILGDDMTPAEMQEIKTHIDGRISQLAQFLTVKQNKFFDGTREGMEWVSSAINGPTLAAQSANNHSALAHLIGSVARLDPVAFAQALAQSPEAIEALTRAMRDQLPLIPTASEVSKAVLQRIRENVLTAPPNGG